MTTINYKFAFIFTLITTLLISCSAENSPKSGETSSNDFPIEAVTLSPELQSIYQRTCKNCHTIPGTQSPQTGDKLAWKEVLSKGIDKTMDNAMLGFKGMPAAGQCYECNPEQVKTLILYMSHPSK